MMAQNSQAHTNESTCTQRVSTENLEKLFQHFIEKKLNCLCGMSMHFNRLVRMWEAGLQDYPENIEVFLK